MFILFVYLMKLMDITTMNRNKPRYYSNGYVTTNNNNNNNNNYHKCGSLNSLSSSSSSSSVKENLAPLRNDQQKQGQFSKLTYLRQHQLQQQHEQHKKQQKMQIIQEYIRQQQQQQQLFKEQNELYHQQNLLKQKQYFYNLQKQKQEYLKNLLFSKVNGNNNISKGNESLRGMTEYPTNDKHKSRQSQLNHNSSLHHHPHHSHNQHQIKSSKNPTITTATDGITLKQRPLTTSPNIPSSYNNYGIPNYFNKSLYYGDFNDEKSLYSSINAGLYDDELTDENLKKNVQIVLNNLDRYNNALRSIILNDQQTNISLNNNSFDSLSTVAKAAAMANILSSPESDYNSNAPHHISFGNNGISGIVSNGGINVGGGIGGNHLNCSIASSHDFTHDNSDYQWFLDYGYRDGFTHQSVLSSLSASYNGIGELSYYEDLAKNIDANLAEVDMESFCAEDIHSLLTHLPALCSNSNKDRTRINSNSNNMMLISKDDQINDMIDNSICKSELLFSPVKESHISVDSLDLESYPDDGDIILTCKANKDNYTIAFEGSALYSDESFYAEPVDPTNATKIKQNCINLHSNLDDIVKRKSLEVSMSRSDHAFTTWSKLKKGSACQLQRYPSGNNNSSVNISNRHALNYNVRKSLSLPNLRLKKESSDRQLNVSQAVSNSTVDSFKSRNLLPMCQMPISSTSGSESPVHTSSNMNSTENSTSKQNQQPAFNLVKLFIKQKSNSSDTCMDVSSGCWPSDNSSSSEQKVRKKSMNDSGKGSALSRHDEENSSSNDDGNVDSSYQLDSLDICDQQNNKEYNNTTPKKFKHDLYREVFETQQQIHQRNNTMNIRNQPLKNPQIYNLAVQNNLNNINNNNNNNYNNNNNNNNNNIYNNNNNNSIERDSLSRDLTNKSMSDISRTSENLTQVFYNNISNNRMKIPAEMITRSMQTSNLLKENNNRVRFVPPSFLAKLNKLGEEKQAPVYVIYPNYALPDLGFVKNNISDIILQPFNYKTVSSKRRSKAVTKDEEEFLKKINYNDIQDWKSLLTLLPIEYRKKLKQIPEADIELEPECEQTPLFCVTAPMRRQTKASTVCDCTTYTQTYTSSSGSSQPPSSGYRGSSTLLTDSEVDMNIKNDNSAERFMKNAYPFLYDNNRTETEIMDRPPPSGRTPRGILRRNLKSASRVKRNSMFEENNLKAQNIEKRRSLQEPYYMSEDIVEEYLADLGENKINQYYAETNSNPTPKLKSDFNFMTDLYVMDKKIHKDHDLDARIRAENFLSCVPKSELKYYAEIASILESSENDTIPKYDSAKLKSEVSRALRQKKVSFNHNGPQILPPHYLNSGGLTQKFSTPPNSPNISMLYRGVSSNLQQHQQRLNERKKELSLTEKEKKDKISSNRFKRLQIQWELISKDSSLLLKELGNEKETKSAGSTPTSANATLRSRIPRPVSYPAIKKNVKTKFSSDIRTTTETKNVRSPSRIIPPKKYTNTQPTLTTTGGNTHVTGVNQTAGTTTKTATTRPRTPNRPNTTPKKRLPSPRPATRTR